MATRRQLPRTTPEAQGVSSQAILAFLEDVEKNVSELHSLMLLRHGNVIAEGWWAPYAPQHPHMLFSLSKSFTSSAVGMAVEEGRLTVDDLVLSFFPEDAPSEPDANLQAMRVRDLLTMSTGHDQDATNRSFAQQNWVKGFLSLPVEHAPGSHFCYNTAATYMLSAILQKVTGEKLIDYLRPRLFQPLGITRPTWESCPRGTNVGGFGLKVTTESIARFGLLYLNNGVWNGKRILSEKWIAEATAKQVPNGDKPDSDWSQGYGYQFWRCRHNCYRADGAFGQYCIVMPEYDAVLAITSGVNDMQAVLTKVWDYLLPAMESAALPAGPTTVALLNERLAGLHFAPPVGEQNTALATQFSGRELHFAANDWGLSRMRCDFAADSATVTLHVGRRKHTVTCGLGEWQFGTSALFGRGPQKVATSGVWTAPDTFQMTLRHYETPFHWTFTCQWTAEGCKLQADANVSFGPTEAPKDIVGKFA